MNDNENDLTTFLEAVTEVAQCNAEACATGGSDPIAEIELNSIVAAARAYAAYSLARALRREYDARMAAAASMAELPAIESAPTEGLN